MSLNDRIKEARLRNGMTQEQQDPPVYEACPGLCANTSVEECY